MKMIVLYLEVRFAVGYRVVDLPNFFFYTSANKVNGRSFSKMKLVHIEQMGVSFGSRIIIETLLEDIVSSVPDIVVWSTKTSKETLLHIFAC